MHHDSLSLCNNNCFMHFNRRPFNLMNMIISRIYWEYYSFSAGLKKMKIKPTQLYKNIRKQIEKKQKTRKNTQNTNHKG